MMRWLLGVRGGVVATGFAVALALGACSDAPSTTLEAGAEPAADGSLRAVLEPVNALIASPGDGWTEIARWPTEGSMTHWDTGCSGFDRLGEIFNHGTPTTVVWARDDDRLFQRTDDFGWDAAEFVAAVEQVPAACPTIEVASARVSVTAVDPASLGPAVDRISEGDPAGRVVAIALDAYPHPSPETDIATPEFEPGRPTWMVIATRHNVVSQLVHGPGSGSADDLPELVAAQIDALLAAPIEATGPFERPAPPPSVAPGTAIDVELFVDSLTCRNDGFVEHDGVRWALVEPVPREWRERIPIVGDLAMDGTTASFTAHPGPPPVPGEALADTDVGREPAPLAGFTVAMTTGAVPAECHPWDDPERVPPGNQVGRLDCDDRPVIERVEPDVGQSPEELAGDADSRTVEVRSDGPLQWSGLDGGGRVVVTLFLGDVDDADWQIFTCSQP